MISKKTIKTTEKEIKEFEEELNPRLEDLIKEIFLNKKFKLNLPDDYLITINLYESGTIKQEDMTRLKNNLNELHEIGLIHDVQYHAALNKLNKYRPEFILE